MTHDSASTNRLEALAADLHTRAKRAVPAVLLYAVLFFLITGLFGTHYIMCVSSAVCIFQGRRQRENNLRTCFTIAVLMLVLTVLAHIATLHVGLSILINATVPFLLVLAQSNQFLPKGYFGFAMVFVFGELMIRDTADFLIQLLATGLAAGVLALALGLWHLWSMRGATPEPAACLDAFADLLDRMAAGEDPQTLERDLMALERRIDRLRMGRQHFLRTPDINVRRYTLYALLVQRALYLIDDQRLRTAVDEPPLDPVLLRELARLVRQTRASASSSSERWLADRIRRQLLDGVEADTRARIFYRSVLHLLVRINELEAAGPVSRVPIMHVPWRIVARDVWRRIDPDTFEFRFACRLAVVLVICNAVCLAFPRDHLYWVTLNAFLLLMPSYEESEHRMRTRPVGTALGCLAAYGISQVLPGTAAVFTVSLLLISAMYFCTPGSPVQATFSTTFALLMASLMMDAVTAAWLRLTYVAVAVALVLVVNRVVMPSRADRIFEGNLRELSRITRRYWYTVRATVAGSREFRATGDLLTRFHLVYRDTIAYAARLPLEEQEAIQRILELRTHLLAEVEQVECLVLTARLDAMDLLLLHRAAGIIARRQTPVDEVPELERIADGMRSEGLAYMLRRYVHLARRLGETEHDVTYTVNVPPKPRAARRLRAHLGPARLG